MLPVNPGGHAAYQNFVATNLRKYYPNPDAFSPATWDIIERFWNLDLSYTDDLLRSKYSVFGPKPRTPSCMQRSYLLSIDFKIHSLTDWAAQLKINPLYAILSGFEFGDTPGVGTFYDFLSRLWDSEDSNLSSHLRPAKEKRIKKPAQKGAKAESVEKVSVDQLLGQLEAASFVLDDQPYSSLFKIYHREFLSQSITKGLIDPSDLSLAGDEILAGKEGAIASYDTQYSKVEITNRNDNGEMVRYMLIGDGCESATYIEEDKKHELVVPYTRYYDLMYEADIDMEHVLMIGGGGYSYPKYCVSHHSETSIDVIEIDEQITELARKYFYLDDALKDFNTEDETRLNIINEDGKVYVNTTDTTYDAILNDAFSGTTPVESLTTLETVERIHKMLNPGGVYLSNIIGSRSGADSKFLAAEVNTISQVFDYVYIIPCGDMGTTESTEETCTNKYGHRFGQPS